ncbi:heavy-metal-associated domain-containing protein [Alicyclobacillus dauci]|uniref:Heavy-metal-associated domain-containing protein n=1 Tax=Alicyclobacillus dauci TaxID=1475485 RepID=A0ABY6Z6N6_9BACL|nr:heavy-metal-associated domain-containing protein [Alicyclobacillus dauci]WAH38272.1 heavy-metal-associated domain-containing protein [Alicyclobacillus dauci]
MTTMTISTITLEGVTCANCANSVSNALHSVQGVENFDVDLFDQITTITYDDDQTSSSIIRSTIEQSNCDVH